MLQKLSNLNQILQSKKKIEETIY